MDGVLVDTEPIYVDVSRRIFAELAVDIPMDRHLGYVGVSAVRMWREIKEDFGLPHSVPELIAKEKHAQIRAVWEKHILDPIPGVEKLLQRLQRQTIPCAIASSSSRELIDLVLHKSGLHAFFCISVSGEDVQNGKPAADIFLAAAQRLKAQPSACLVIEDSPHGIAGAKAAGMKTCGFVNANSGNQDLSAADLIVDSFSDSCIELILNMLASKPRAS
jgi:HAD superfamily hydrolase (TIGR01509 family)